MKYLFALFVFMYKCLLNFALDHATESVSEGVIGNLNHTMETQDVTKTGDNS